VTGPGGARAVSQTQFRPDAAGQLLELWQQVMPRDAPNSARFRDLALLNPPSQRTGLTGPSSRTPSGVARMSIRTGVACLAAPCCSARR
jgi:hypothetical protein